MAANKNVGEKEPADEWMEVFSDVSCRATSLAASCPASEYVPLFAKKPAATVGNRRHERAIQEHDRERVIGRSGVPIVQPPAPKPVAPTTSFISIPSLHDPAVRMEATGGVPMMSKKDIGAECDSDVCSHLGGIKSARQSHKEDGLHKEDEMRLRLLMFDM